MIVMREILNVKQTQVHPGDPSYGWKWKAFLDDLSDRSSAAQGRQGKGNTRQGFQPESPLSTPDLEGFESLLRGLYGQKSAAAPKESSFSVSFAHACC